MNKNEVIIKNIIWEHHPTFKDTVKSLDLINFNWFDTSKLLEESMAYVGNYKLIDVKHADFSDGSDCKTSTINSKRQGVIGRVCSNGGNMKHGMLRVVIYNSIKQSVMFYALPKSAWSRLVTIHSTNGEGSLRYSYVFETDTIPKFEDYKCNTFEDLCLKKNNNEKHWCFTECSTLESFFV